MIRTSVLQHFRAPAHRSLTTEFTSASPWMARALCPAVQARPLPTVIPRAVRRNLPGRVANNQEIKIPRKNRPNHILDFSKLSFHRLKELVSNSGRPPQHKPRAVWHAVSSTWEAERPLAVVSKRRSARAVTSGWGELIGGSASSSKRRTSGSSGGAGS